MSNDESDNKGLIDQYGNPFPKRKSLRQVVGHAGKRTNRVAASLIAILALAAGIVANLDVLEKYIRNKSNSENLERFITVKPIENLESLKNSFLISTNPAPTLELVFESSKLKVKHPFSVSTSVTIGELKKVLVDHFQIKEHISIDTQKFPSGGGWWESRMILTASGRQISDLDFSENEKAVEKLAVDRMISRGEISRNADGRLTGGLVARINAEVEIEKELGLYRKSNDMPLAISTIRPNEVLGIKVEFWFERNVSGGGQLNPNLKIVQPPPLEL